MARKPSYQTALEAGSRTLGEIVRDHARRRLSLEEGAAELGCCTLTYRGYLHREGAYVKRTVTLRELERESSSPVPR